MMKLRYRGDNIVVPRTQRISRRAGFEPGTADCKAMLFTATTSSAGASKKEELPPQPENIPSDEAKQSAFPSHCTYPQAELAAPSFLSL